MYNTDFSNFTENVFLLTWLFLCQSFGSETFYWAKAPT